MANGVKNAYTIQAINAFIRGMIFIVIPLMMLDRGIAIESMGLIFAVLPLVTQLNRLLFGTISDYIGRKKFYFFNGIMNMLFLGVYYTATTPFGFLFGKITEGIRNASLWSVNRAYFMDHSENKERSLMMMRGLNGVFEALGTLLAGFLVVTILYENTILLLVLLSVLIFPNVRMLKDKRKVKLNLKMALKSLDFRHKSRKFKNFIGIFFLIGLSWGFIGGYIFPTFLKTMGIPVGMIGLLLGIRIMFNGLSVYAFSSLWDGRRKILVGGILFSIAVSALAFVDLSILPMVIILMGMVGGLGDAGHESIFVTVADEKSIGKDIGTLMIGTHVGISITQALSGFVITNLGYQVLFPIAGLLYMLFSITAYYNLNSD